MTAVWYRFRSELRDRWKSVAALAVLAGLAGGVTLAALAGARRTDSAFSRLLDATDAAQVLVNPDYGNDSGLDWDAVGKLPMVASSGIERGLLVQPLPIDGPADLDSGLAFGFSGGAGDTVARPLVYQGRAPDRDRADEVLVNDRFAALHGVGVGDRFDVLVLGQGDFRTIEATYASIEDAVAAMNDGTLGRHLSLRVSGIGEVPEGIVVDEGFEDPELFASPAFLREHPDADAGFGGVLVRLRHGAADIPAFKEAVQALPHEGAIEFQTTTVTEAKVARAVRPQVGALTVFALVIALTGLLLVGQALARQTFLDSFDHPTLRALGFGRRQLMTVALLRSVVIALGAMLLAAVLAVAASPLTPIGVARDADPDLGVFVDAPVVVGGALVVFVAVVVLGAAAAWWHTRRARERGSAPAGVSRLVGWTRGAPPAADAGVRMALEPGRGRTAVPVRTTIVGIALAIATVVAALTFASSLDHLVSTPRLYGFAWDAKVETSGESEEEADAIHRDTLEALLGDRSVRALSDATISRVEFDDVAVTTVSFEPVRGSLGPTVVDGRAPRAAGEVALGAKTMDRIGVGIGDTVQAGSDADASGATHALRVVGRVVLPGLGTYQGSDKTALGEGAVLTPAALRRLGPDFGTGSFLVQLTEDGSVAGLARTVSSAGDPTQVQVTGLQRPSDILSYDRVRATPLLLAAVLAVLGIATMAHALVTAVRRRGRDLALLKTLGFTRRQVSSSVAWQATTLGAASLVLGVPVGVVVGRIAWNALADNLGTLAEPIVPVLALVVGIPVVLLLANLIAFVPGRIAARVRPAVVLRSE